MDSTGFVPAYICWLAYLAAAASVAVCFAMPLPWHPWQIGLLAICAATFSIYAFSFAYSNTSVYDPAWCLLPIFVAVGWMSTAESAPSSRGWYAFALLVSWYLRYALWWPWDGWTVGIHTEDWRYKQLADKVGGAGALYWLLSLTSLHLTPSLLVFFGLGPLQQVWTQGSARAQPLGLTDVAALCVALSAIVANGVADTQLRAFREKATAKSGSSLETAHCDQVCRVGLWAYSRHPNYCSEATFWLGVALAAHAGDSSGAVPFGWTWGGSLVMFLFFRLSASLMDRRSLKHRRGFAKLMREVPALLPMPLAVDGCLDRLLISGVE